MYLKKILALSVFCSLLIAFMGTASAETSYYGISEEWTGAVLGVVIVLALVLWFYRNGTLSFLNTKKTTEKEGLKLFDASVKNMRSIVARSGEFPSSIWNDIIESIVDLANQEGGKEKIKLLGGEVICIGSLESKAKGLEFHSKFLKGIIKEEIPLYKKIGNRILPHKDEYHFRVINGISSFFHYHINNQIEQYYNINSRGLALKFEEKFRECFDNNTEEFNLEKAKKDNYLVIELEKKDEKEGIRYRHAKKEEIDDFEKFLNN